MRRLPLLPEAPRPLLFAHRGISSEAPENTMAAFRLARDRGIPGIELDVHLTADGKLAVIHDDFTGRVAPEGKRGEDGRGLEIGRSSWAELRELDVGSWKGSAWSSERIPLLPELLEEFGGDLYVDIEIKNGVRADFGLEAAVAACIRARSRASRAKETLLVSSYNPFSLARFKSLEPAISTAIIWQGDEHIPFFLRRGEGRWLGRVDVLKPEKGLVRPAAGFAWRRIEGYPLLPWVVDDRAEASRLLGLGCEGVISNAPGGLGIGFR